MTRMLLPARLSTIHSFTSGLVLLLLFVFTSLSHAAAHDVKEEIVFTPSGVSVSAERAESPEKRSRGLMDRTSMGAREAMIFIFEETACHSFWMYRTRIPLTIMFVDKDFTIVDIQDMTPCPARNPSACPVYTAKKPAQYAIEVNQGFAARHGIKVGSRITVLKDK